MNSRREMAERTTIIRGVVGSTVHGLNVQDGIEDRDEMGVCVEDIQYVAGLQNFEQYIYRTAAEREGKHNARSRAGDLDLVIYSLRKFLRLALQGNPTIINLLFTPGDFLVACDARGSQLRELSPYIASREAGKRYLGYLQSQRERLLGRRGQRDVRRPELESQYGFDTKYAMHMLRLGYQGIDYLKTGRITLPMPEPQRTFLLMVRTGKIPQAQCIEMAEALEADLQNLLDTSPLPEHPNTAEVERWMIRCYLNAWQCRLWDERIQGSAALSGNH